MKCKDCDCCRPGWFKSSPDKYVCIGVKEPFVIDDINNNCTEYPEKNMIRCPHCNGSYYYEKYTTTTCVNCPPIYKDGVHINPHNNKVTTYCHCLNCGKEFSYVNRV